jgi:hypothetical protein
MVIEIWFGELQYRPYFLELEQAHYIFIPTISNQDLLQNPFSSQHQRYAGTSFGQNEKSTQKFVFTVVALE